MANIIGYIKLPNNTTYTLKDNTLTVGPGITLTTNSITGIRTIANSGVRSITTGSTDGTISVNTGGTTTNVSVHGLGSAAYTSSSAYATASQGTLAENAMPKTGGTFTGAVALNSDPINNLEAATKQYVDNNVSISGNLSSGTEIATITINGTQTKLYSPGTPTTISVIQSIDTPTLEFITSTNTTASSTLTGITSSSSLQDGKMIVYRLAYPLNGQDVSINLFNTSSVSLGVIPLYINGTTRCKAKYSSGTMLFMTYYQNAFYLVNPFGIVA